jgi:hypothetical protein
LLLNSKSKQQLKESKPGLKSHPLFLRLQNQSKWIVSLKVLSVISLKVDYQQERNYSLLHTPSELL